MSRVNGSSMDVKADRVREGDARDPRDSRKGDC
jgi:hypothetical protein